MSTEPQPDDPGMVRLQVWVPLSWRSRLRELAEERAVSTSDVVRILLRENLYPPRRPAE